MNNRIFALAISLLIFASCKNEDKKAEGSAPLTKDSAISQSLTDPYFYKSLEGTIAGKPVVLNLVKTGNRLDANYYYTEKGQPIFLMKNWEKTAKDSFYFIEITNPSNGQSAQLSMAIVTNGLRGTWTSADGAASYPIDLKTTSADAPLELIAMSKIDTAYYTRFKSDTPTLKAAVTVVAASGHDDHAEWLNDRVKSIIANGNKKLKNLSLSQTVDALVSDAVNGYEAEVDSSIVGVDDDGPHYFLNREYETLSNVIFNQHGLLTLSVFNYAYTGGAHGNHATSMHCFDLTNRKELKLSDITSADSVVLGRLLEQQYRKQYEVPAGTPLSQRLFVDKLAPNNNFYLSPTGIGFCYAPYEIASYADGQINIWIPFSDLKGYLNPEFAKRMHL
ncbi:DUF3298 and DUF4163 domain-containing protein [Niabella insulamsoli]|uniref:DUF3298 and DUF4163 domain-containing protein n=1 Tax=Niabella insulamsoli TaxID=3144874 RepID=UPI0031FDDAC6